MLLKLVTENGERGTGNRERESGNECTAVTRLRIQHGGHTKRKGNNLEKCEKCSGCKRGFLPAVPPDHVPRTFL